MLMMFLLNKQDSNKDIDYQDYYQHLLTEFDFDLI